MKSKTNALVAFLILAIVVMACGNGPGFEDQISPPDNGPIHIVADSTVALLESSGILSSCGIPYTIQYIGSVEMKLKVQSYSQNNPGDVDVFWAASPTWLPGSFVVNKTPIMGTYVVLGVDPAVASQFGWNTTAGISVSNIMEMANSHALSLAMASSSQDDAAANFYLAVLTALKGTGEPLVADDLVNPAILGPMKTFYSNVSRGSNNSSDLASTFVADRLSGKSQFNSFVLPEAMAISVNQQLVANGQKPMLAFYVKDAVGLQSFTIGYTKDTSKEKQDKISSLVGCLTSSDSQRKLQSLGFRTGSVGMKIGNPDRSVFNPEWGINGDIEYVTVSLPKPAVIEAALNTYQLELRKGSCTAYILDYSGSMKGTGNAQLLAAMKLLLNQTEAAGFFLQMSPNDTTYVVIFNGGIIAEYVFTGNDANGLYKLTDPKDLRYDEQSDPDHKNSLNPYDANSLFGKIYYQQVDGGTDFYEGAIRGLQHIQNCSPDHLTAIALLTDGDQREPTSFRDLKFAYDNAARKSPIYTILLGDAKYDPLHEISVYTGAGEPCDGRGSQDDLVRCFRNIKGSN